MSNNNNSSEIEVGEIKDILEKLQNLQISEKDVPTKNKDKKSTGVVEPKPSNNTNRNKLLYSILLPLSLFVSGGIIYTVYFQSPSTDKIIPKPEVKIEKKETPEKKKILPLKKAALPQKEIGAIKTAKTLLAAGSTLSARNLLLKEQKNYEKVAEIPFMIAQTYDPNFLKTLTSTDVDAELGEAERWYRIWFRVAGESTNPPSREQFDNILNGLR